MKKIVLGVLCALLALVLAVCCAELWYLPRYLVKKTARQAPDVGQTDAIHIVSANVRCFSPTDLGRQSWFYRAELLLDTVMDAKPDIIGFQEVTRLHYKYLTDCLPDYGSVLQYRDDSLFSEGCPVFYNTVRFDLADKGSFWLSETPAVMSRDWGSKCRICSYVILTEKATGKQLVVFNTHLDHVSDEARIKGIGVVLDKIREFGGLPSVIMGDLNCGEGSETYRAATEHFLDAKYQTEDTMTGATYQNFGKQLERENIDYFMISKTGIRVDSYRVLQNTPGGVYPSDHFPIMMTIDLT